MISTAVDDAIELAPQPHLQQVGLSLVDIRPMIEAEDRNNCIRVCTFGCIQRVGLVSSAVGGDGQESGGGRCRDG